MVCSGGLGNLLWGCSGFEIPAPSPQPVTSVEQTVSQEEFHYSGSYCKECHEQLPTKKGNPFLKYDGDFNRLCRCHLTGRASYVHPVNVAPSGSLRQRIGDALPLTNGKVTCLTCHDIYRQCQQRDIEKFSLRGAPYANRLEFCFKCHDAQRYEKMDPHKQRNVEGGLLRATCLYCHTEKPDEKTDGYQEVRLLGNLDVLCQRCHMIRGNHAGNFDHMIRPSPQAVKHIKEMENRFQTVLPLDKTGKMTCATCHNPHDQGVIAPDKPGAKGAGAKFRHRVPGRLCAECHRL